MCKIGESCAIWYRLSQSETPVNELHRCLLHLTSGIRGFEKQVHRPSSCVDTLSNNFDLNFDCNLITNCLDSLFRLVAFLVPGAHLIETRNLRSPTPVIHGSFTIDKNLFYFCSHCFL